MLTLTVVSRYVTTKDFTISATVSSKTCDPVTDIKCTYLMITTLQYWQELRTDWCRGIKRED